MGEREGEEESNTVAVVILAERQRTMRCKCVGVRVALPLWVLLISMPKCGIQVEDQQRAVWYSSIARK